ncbi:MAG: hypothetical protein ACFFDP_04990 [Promethearchaeota archaeon]
MNDEVLFVQLKLKYTGIFILCTVLLGTSSVNALDNNLVLNFSIQQKELMSPNDPWGVLWMSPQNDYFTALAGIVGAVFVAGETMTHGGPDIYGRDLFLAKYTPEGELVWNHTWPNLFDEATRDLAAATDALYLVGETYQDNENPNGLLMKIDFNGNPVWNVSWGVNATERFTSVAIGDGVYVSGYSYNTSINDVDAVLAKFDFNGNELWNVSWNEDDVDYGADVAVGSNGVYLVGWISSEWSKTPRDAFLAKFSPSGVQIWNTTWGGSESDIGSGVIAVNNSIFVTGGTESYSSGSYYDLTLLKYNNTGSLLWNVTDSAGYSQSGYDLINSSDGIYVAGSLDLPSIRYRSSLHHFDFNGTLLWKRYWGGAGYCKPDALALSIDSLYIAGTTNFWLTDEANGFLVKYNLDGSSAPGPIELQELEDPDHDGTFSASWTEALDPDGTIAGYELQMARSPIFSWYNITWTTTQTTFTVTDRTDGLYYFRVRARDNASLHGPWSNIQGINVTIILMPSINPWLAPIILALGAGIMVTIILVLFIRRWRIE